MMALFRTKDWKMVTVKGADAQAYLHRISSINIEKLESGYALPGLLLDATSNIHSEYICVRAGAESYHFLLKDDGHEDLFSGLEKLHFSEELEIQKLDPLPGAELWQGSESLDPTKFCAEIDSEFAPQKVQEVEFAGVWFRQVPLYENGWSALLPEESGYGSEQVSRCLGKVDNNCEIGEEFWDHLRILAAIPKRGYEWEPGKTKALDAGLRRWLDRSKGCYPGQEAVEKSLNVGHPAKVMLRIEFENPEALEVKTSQKVVDGIRDSPIGDLTSISRRMHSQKRCMALALLRWKFHDTIASNVFVMDEFGHRVIGKIYVRS